MTVQLRHDLKIIGTAHQAVRMMCANAMSLNEDVCAYVAGIKVGESRVEGEFEPGDIIEYPIAYLPWVDLPTEVRFVSERSGEEVADAFRIVSHDDAVSLIGMGDAVVQSIAIDQGVIRGLVINRVNGLLRPQMFARINGVVPRAITVEHPRLLDDGGASFQFSAPLHPADLVENGLTAEIFLLGKDTPLTSVAFRRADVDDLTKRIVEFEARMAQMAQSNTLRFKAVEHELTQRLNLLQERIDSFIEYSASFMFDRIAATEVPTSPGAPPLAPDLQDKIDAFLALVRGAGRQALAPPEVSVLVPFASSAFSFGWHEVEERDGVPVRWMSDHAVLFNPHPDRAVESVRLVLAGAHGTAQPVLRAAFDQVPAVLSVDRRGQGGRDVAVIAWPKERRPGPVQAVTIANLLSAAPVAGPDGRSGRSVSVAVAAVTFVYAAANTVAEASARQVTTSSKRIA